MDREEMIERFANFLRNYVDNSGKEVYINKLIDLLTITPKRSLTIDWAHLNSIDPELAAELIENPEEAILAAEDAIQIILREPPILKKKELKIHARFTNLPRTLLVKELGSEHINRLIQVDGIITRVSEVKPFVEKAVFVCKDCGNEMVRLQRPYDNIVKPSKCDACGSRNVELDVEKSRFINFQSFRLQDRPESLKGGQMPRFIDAILLDDLVDTALPGDRVLVTGILRVILEQKDKRPIFKKVLEVNHIEQLSKEIEELEITPEDEQKIRELAKRKDIVDAIVDSIAPAIWGHKTVKKGIALALFGGVQRVLPDGTKLRGESHVLLVGDPGVAKSQILRYVANLAPRAIYTSGKSSSAAGLTAAAVRDEFTGSWVLEAGVLVLADGGFALIDEFDKMSDRDRSAIHEALEQQTISISKAGITATLNSRTTVIAAANPKYGRFNRHKSLPEQLDLPPTLLSRFDLIFLLLDEPDEKIDASIAEHILKVRRGEAEAVTPKIPYDLLKKYIAYARKNIHPVLSKEAMDEIKRYYVRMRKGFRKSGEDEGVQPIPITARQLEALIRLSEAHARMRLSETVTREDARAAIQIIEEMIRKIATDEEGTLDVSILEVGKSSKKINKIDKLIDIIKSLESEGEFGAPEDKVVEAAKQAGIGTENEVKKLINDLKRDARIYEPRAGFYRVL
ncbi:minichromosome maintenance protein MCM [Thermococcus sp. GR6]|uniref:minichromosome maintenance protein MCM n=1 Tax=Thermococcus sp. GR6 TaxID=1638256 RepID=UPI0014303B5B|nr:minichromosome maintenance protein MCM [Thermococcus sp. GR6]NJE42742.1 minichromosome maintenance protein MCM [Thermococcus sp. GR6]